MKTRQKCGLLFGFAVILIAAIFSFSLTGCPTGSDDGNREELIDVTHMTGFQGVLSNGSLIEIEVEDTSDGDQDFTLYISGAENGTGVLTLSSGLIIAIKSSTNSSLTYSGGVCYDGVQIPMRKADDKVWVHWGVYYNSTMGDFTTYAAQHNGDADWMYSDRPQPNEEGYYYGNPGNPSYGTPYDIYMQARADYPQDAPPISVLNQAITILNDHKNTGVGAYVSHGDLIAYYLRRVQ
jgi:hypothetical protein